MHVLTAASCGAGMTETSPICTMGALKVSLLSHLICHADQQKYAGSFTC